MKVGQGYAVWIHSLTDRPASSLNTPPSALPPATYRMSRNIIEGFDWNHAQCSPPKVSLKSIHQSPATRTARNRVGFR